MVNKKKAGSRLGLLRRLRKHLDRDPGKLAVLEQKFEPYERPNVHLAYQSDGRLGE